MESRRISMPAMGLAFLVALGASAMAARPVAASTTFVVNRIGNASDNNLADAKCDTSTTSGKQCTLRAAIQEANDTPGFDTINFNITSTSKVIAPTSPLPPLTEQVTIDGYSQSGASANTQAVGNNAVLKIVLDGVNAGVDADGLVMADYKIVVRGLVIQRFDGSGVVISGTKSSVQGNRIGTNAAGTVARANGIGVLVSGDQNTVGGQLPAARNVISGNLEEGIRIKGPDVLANSILGNYVGTTASGGSGLGNGDYGILIATQADQTRIGGTSAGDRNVISSNGNHGIAILGSNETSVMGNLIGTTADGSGDLGNGGEGVSVQASSDSIIGGAVAGSGNLISGNGSNGINFHGTASFDNEARGNVVRLNDEHGISVSSRRAVIAGNLVFGNALDGIEIFEFPQATANRNRITGNQIHGNGGLGIDLVGGTETLAGVTANDTDDPDSGPNDLQNFPVITSATRSNATGVTTVALTLNSTPSTEFRIELFLAAPDASGHGEGHVPLAAQNVVTNAGGDQSFSFASNSWSVNMVLTATATSTATDNTSEFSANRVVVAGP